MCGVLGLLLGKLDSYDEHVLGDQQSVQDTPYFTQLCVHSCFSGSGESRLALFCFYLLVLSVPSHTQSYMT